MRAESWKFRCLRAKTEAIRVLRDDKGPGLAGHPVSMSEGEINKKTNNLKTRHRNAKRSKSGQSRNRAARRLRGICFIDPDDEEFKDVMKSARRKLAMPSKLQRDKYRETCRVEEHKTHSPCVVQADEQWRNMGKMEKIPHGSLRKSETKIR